MLRTIGFVLKKTNIGEFDRGYCFFTKKYGKINLTARSVKKPLSKLSGQLEPPSLVSFVFTPMGNGGLLTTALAKKSFLNIRRDYDRLRIYQSWCNIIDDFTLEKHPDAKLWLLIKNCINLLRTKNPFLLDLLFVAGFLSTIGYNLNTNNCTHCQKSLTHKKNIGYDFSKGGFVCHQCTSPKTKLLSWEAYEVINIAFITKTSSYKTIFKHIFSLKTYKEAILFLKDYLNHIKNFY